MQIPDLCYLHSVPEDELILGSAGVSVISEASAFGSENYINANAITTSFTGNDSKAFGIGLAGAIGDRATAKVTVAGSGSIVIKKTKSEFSKKTAVTSGSIIAID